MISLLTIADKYLSDIPLWQQEIIILFMTFLIAGITYKIASPKTVQRIVPKRIQSNETIQVIRDTLFSFILIAGFIGATYPLNLPNTTEGILISVFVTCLIIIFGRAISHVVNQLITVSSRRQHFDDEFQPIIENIASVSIVVISILVLFRVWGINVTPLIASAGLLTVIAGLAARDTMANFFGGMFLYYDDTFKLGDYIQIGDDTEGTVIDMSIRSTVLRTRDGIQVTIPNSRLSSLTVINHSAPENRKRLDISVGVSYDSDLDTVENVLENTVAKNVKFVLENPTPRARLESFGDSAVIYNCQFWISTPGHEPEAKHMIIKNIKKEFQNNNIDIPFPQRNVHLEPKSPQKESN